MISKEAQINNKKLYFCQSKDELSQEVIVIVGGFNDDRNSYDALVQNLAQKINNTIITFSFTRPLNNDYPTFEMQIEDLIEFIKFLVQKGVKKVNLVATSDGSVSSTFALFDDQISKNISTVINIDPAIYYLSALNKRPNFIWPGYVTYEPEEKVISDLLSEYSYDALIHVAHFTIRNYGPNRYVADVTQRGEDNSDMYTRLNTQMVKAFYEKIPSKNKGKYKEFNDIPHAFMRDGYVDKNIHKLSEYICSLLV